MDIDRTNEPMMGTVSFGGIKKQICFDLVPEAVPGEYVLVHVGFALTRVNQEEAMETIKMIRDMDGGLEELRGEE
jgi:hydrogenase expression/formation protein HypC